jgi:membrane associated rhomboid family serine protease
MNIMDEIKDSFKKGSTLTKLIYINLGVFLVVNLIRVLFTLTGHGKVIEDFVNVYLMVPAYLPDLLKAPWTLLTYQFLHLGFLHILFNMLWLFWFGRIFLHYLTQKQLVTTYLLGGFIGALLYITAYNVFPLFSDYLLGARALGASAAVTAIVISVSFYSPNHTVYIPFIGPVKIIYIAIFFIVTDLLQITSGNAGGHIAHLGGALYGYLFSVQLRRGKNVGRGFERFMDSLGTLFKPRTRLKVSHKKTVEDMDDMEYNKMKADKQKEIDRILDKIAQSGYDSLTKKEKETLFKMSNNH